MMMEIWREHSFPTIILTEFPTKTLSTSSATITLLTLHQENPSSNAGKILHHISYSLRNPHLSAPITFSTKYHHRFRFIQSIFLFFFSDLGVVCCRSGVFGGGVERHRISGGRLLWLHNCRRRHSWLPTGGDAFGRV